LAFFYLCKFIIGFFSNFFCSEWENCFQFFSNDCAKWNTKWKLLMEANLLPMKISKCQVYGSGYLKLWDTFFDIYSCKYNVEDPSVILFKSYFKLQFNAKCPSIKIILYKISETSKRTKTESHLFQFKKGSVVWHMYLQLNIDLCFYGF
jgi:hypothetical protein